MMTVNTTGKATLTAVVAGLLAAIAPSVAQAAGAINAGQIAAQLEAANGQITEACAEFIKVTNCWSCTFVDKFAATGLSAAASSYESIAPMLVPLLLPIFGVWILFQALRMFMPDGPGLGALKGIAVRILIMTIVISCLTESGFELFAEWIFTPIMHGGGQMSQLIMETFGGTSDAQFSQYYGPLVVPQSTIAIDGAPDLKETFNEILETVGKMQQINTWGFMMGLAMIGPASILSLDILQMLGGLVLMFFFGVAIVAFPFYIIDLFFRAILLTVMAPLAIAGVAFNFSRRITIQALTGLVQSAATIGILGAVVGLVSALMVEALRISGKADFPTWTCDIFTEPDSVGFGFSEPSFWFLMCAGILSIGAMSKARGVVGALIGSFDDGKSLGEKAAGWAGRGMMFAGTVATTGATLGVGAVHAGATAGAGGTLGAIKAGIGHFASAAWGATTGGGASKEAALLKKLTTGGMGSGNPEGGSGQ